MKHRNKVIYILVFMMVFINIIPANDVGKSQRVYAGAPSIYEDFYEADELPDSNIV